MAKRLTATDKWDDDWYLNLSPKMKCVWTWLCDHCDGCGFKKISLQKLSRDVGGTVSREEFEATFADRIHWVKTDEIWIHGYISAQYKTLSAKNRAHLNIAKKTVRDLQGQNLIGKAQRAYEKLLGFVQESFEAVSESTPSPRESGPDSARDRASLIGNRKQEIGNRKELRGGVGEKKIPQENWPFEPVQEFFHIIPELDENLPEAARIALSTAPSNAQAAWLRAYPDPAWIRQELLNCMAHLSVKKPKHALSTFGSFFGNWLANNWKHRKPNESAKPLDWDFITSKGKSNAS